MAIKFLDVAEFTTLNLLSLLISRKPSFPIVGLKMPSLPTLALKSPKKTLIWYLGGIYRIYLPIPHRSCLSHHQFYPLLGHERADHATPLYPQKLALNFIDKWRSLGIVRLQTKGMNIQNNNMKQATPQYYV
jgi:hypothetical protein